MDSELTSVVDSTGTTLASLGYDNLGRRTALNRNSEVNTAYGYDGASRISSIAHALPSGQSQAESYTYSAASQVLSKTGSNDGWAWNGGYNFNRSYTSNGLNEQLTAGTNNLTWSTKGTLANDSALSYSYDTNNNLFAASNGSVQVYDAANRLYSVGASGATRFLYDGDFAIAEYNTSGGVNRRFVPGPSEDEPLVWYEGSGTTTRYGLTADRMGSVTGITTDAGALSAVNSYDEYGIPGPANAGRYQYTGQKFLTEYGMYDYKARVYSPTLGRFVQPDPIGYGDGINFYQYVHSDPLNGTDPMGLDDDVSLQPGEQFDAYGSKVQEFPIGDVVVTGQRLGVTGQTSGGDAAASNTGSFSNEPGGADDFHKTPKMPQNVRQPSKSCRPATTLLGQIANGADNVSNGATAVSAVSGLAALATSETIVGGITFAGVSAVSGLVSIGASGVGATANFFDGRYGNAAVDAFGAVFNAATLGGAKALPAAVQYLRGTGATIVTQSASSICPG